MTSQNSPLVDPLTDEECETILMLLGSGWRHVKCRGYFANLYTSSHSTLEKERIRIDEKSMKVLSPEEVAHRKAKGDVTKAWYPR